LTRKGKGSELKRQRGEGGEGTRDNAGAPQYKRKQEPYFALGRDFASTMVKGVGCAVLGEGIEEKLKKKKPRRHISLYSKTLPLGAGPE